VGAVTADEPSILIGVIGLKSVPAMQWGQRMVRIVSIGNGRSCTVATETARRIPNAKSSDPAESQRIVGDRIDVEPNPCRDSGRRADRRAGQAR
jgi:hypothetical protein